MSELLGDNEMREILATYDSPIDFRECMDNGDIVLINLSPEAMGDDPARAFGALLVREMFYCSARRNPRLAESKPFYLYIDECADFLTNDISKILARSRKRGLHVILAHQWLEQLRKAGDDIYHGVMGIQNKVIFGGLSDEDAVIMADQLFRTEYDLELPISVLTKPGVDRYERTWFNNWSESSSESASSSYSDASSESDSFSEMDSRSISLGVNTSVAQVYDEYGFPTATYTMTDGTSEIQVDARGQTSGKSRGSSRSASSSSSTTTSYSYGASEGLIPVLKDFVGGVHSMENVRHMAISRLRQIPPQNAVVKGFDTPTFDISTFFVDDVIVHQDNVARFKQRVFSSSPYVQPQLEVSKRMIETEQDLYRLADMTRDLTEYTEHPGGFKDDHPDGTF